MRTSRLRRWLLRGALLTAATLPLAVGEAAHAEFTWQQAPATVVNPAEPEAGTSESGEERQLTEEEFTWQ